MLQMSKSTFKIPHTSDSPQFKHKNSQGSNDTYGDLLPLVGLQDPDPNVLLATKVLQGKLWPRFLQLSIAHVKDANLISLSNCYSTVACNSIVPAATVPLARMDLKLPGEASVQDESASLVVFISPAHNRLTEGEII